MAPRQPDVSVGEEKRRLRARLLAARAGRSEHERAVAAAALTDRVLALPEIRSVSTIGCYVPMPQEPGSEDLLHALSGLGHRVLLPLLRPDFDLSWAEYHPGALRTARFGIAEPTGPELGVEAVTEAGVVIAPALAADRRGHRLGRGGGSYDRVLPRLPSAALRVVLLYDDELLDAVPADAHDEPVHVAVTPRRTVRVRPR